MVRTFLAVLLALASMAWAGIGDSRQGPVVNQGVVNCAGGAWNLDAGTLYADCTNNRAGIGTTSPATKLHMSSGTLTVDGNVQLGINLSATFKPWSRTKAQIGALTPGTVGEYVFCSDCTIPGLCVSTGTAVAQWRRDFSATVGCGSDN